MPTRSAACLGIKGRRLKIFNQFALSSLPFIMPPKSSTPRLRLPSTADMSDELVGSCQVFLSKGVRPPSAFLDPDYSKAGIADYLFPTLKTTSPSPKSSTNDFPTTTYPQALVKWYEPAVASNDFSYAEASDLFIAVKRVQAAFSDAYYQRRTNDEDEQLVLLEAGLEDARPALTYLSDFWGNVRNCPLFAMITRGFVHQMIVDISSFLTTEEKVNLLKGWAIPETELDHLQDYYSLSKQKFEVFPPIPLNPFDLEGACLISLLDNPSSWFIFPGQDRLDYAPESTKPDERNEEVEGPDDDEVEVEKEAKSASPEVGHRVLRSVGKPAVRYSTSGHAKRPASPSSEDSDSSTEVRKKPAKRQKPFVSMDDDVPLSRLVKSTAKAIVDGPKANSAATRTVIRPLQRADRIRPVPPRNKTSVAASAPSTSKSSSKGKGKGKANKATSGSGAKQEYHPKSKFIKDVEGVSVVGDFLASDSFVPEETDLLGSRTQYTTGPDMLLRMPHFQIDKSLMALGGIVGRNGFNMSVGDIQRLAFPLPKPARMENGDQLGFCLECVRAGKDDCDYQRPQSRCRNCQTLKLQCSKTLDLEKGLDVMNVTLAHFRNAPENAQARFRVAQDLRQALDLAVEGYTAQRKLIGFLSGQFLEAFNEFKATMDDPLIVLKSLAYSPEDPVARFSYDQFALLATLFKWNSKLNFSEVDTGDKTLLEWLEHVKFLASEPLSAASTSGGLSKTIVDLFPSDERSGDIEMEAQDDDGEGEDELAEGLATSVPIVGSEASLAGSPSSSQIVADGLSSFSTYFFIVLWLQNPFRLNVSLRTLQGNSKALSAATTRWQSMCKAAKAVYHDSRKPPPVSAQHRLWPFIKRVYDELTNHVFISEHARELIDATAYVPFHSPGINKVRLHGFNTQLENAVREIHPDKPPRKMEDDIDPSVLRYIKTGEGIPTGTPLKRETGKATNSGPSQSKKRKVDKVDHQSGDQSQTLLDQDTDMSDAPVLMARGHKSDVIPADLRSESDRGRNSSSFRDGLATVPHKNPAALAYLTHRLWSLVVEMYRAQLPKWCHYLAKLPVELVDITKTQLEQERYGRWKRCGPKPRHPFHERRCDCENFSPERVRLVVDSLRAIPSSSLQRLERTNPVSIQLLDEVAQTSIGEFSELPTGMLNSMINFHRVEALHATHIALVHHNRAITSNRICEDAFKVLSNRANYADGKDDGSNSMDVQGSGAAVHIPSSKDVEIPGVSDSEDDGADSDGHESDTRTVRPPGPTGYHSN
ncbi:hypothetical protein D9757_014967 [Collybiopsis confluens]|uniref:Uncharacterized protein n=1 Tax=Collybiopsis confluens TaxID=2823264 RepID=A0A8H5FQL4_9AGAR|nr:hypothetical protein D9757_014967 [Collybiopsis confluens]